MIHPHSLQLFCLVKNLTHGEATDHNRESIFLHRYMYESPYPQGSWFEQSWFYPTWGCFHMVNSISCGLVSEKILKTFLYTCIYLWKKFDSPIGAPFHQLGSWFEQIWIYPTGGCFHKILSFLGQIVIEKKIYWKFLRNFELFLIISPEKSVILNFHNFEFPLPKDDFCQVWLKLAQ